MGDTIDKLAIEYQNKCPIHDCPFTGVCVEKDCYETGIICPKCNPQSCIDTLGHEKMSMDQFFKSYIRNVLSSINLTAFNELIASSNEIKKKQLELQAQAFEEWELKIINQKFNQFQERISKKIDAFIDDLMTTIQKVFEQFKQSKMSLVISDSMPEFKINSTLQFFEENKNNKQKIENYLENMKKFMDTENLDKCKNNLENLLYGKFFFDHIKDYLFIKDKENHFKEEIKDYLMKMFKSIFPDEKEEEIFTNKGKADFRTNPLKLKYKETLTNKTTKSYTINNTFDVYSTFDGNCYLAASVNGSNYIEIYSLKSNALTTTLKESKQQIFIIRHYAQKSTKTDFLLSTNTAKNANVWNLKNYNLILSIKNCHTGSYIYSALILFDEVINKGYVVTSSPNDFIKIWDFEKGYFIRDIGSTADYTYFINYWKNDDKYYIIDGNSQNISIYGMNKKFELFGEYISSQKTWHMCAFVEKYNGVNTLFGSDGVGNVSLWNLETNKLIKSIKCPSCNLRGLSIWNNQYILAASSDKSIKIVDLLQDECVGSIQGAHTNSLCSIKKVVHPKYGESVISASVDGTIKLWVNEEII